MIRFAPLLLAAGVAFGAGGVSANAQAFDGYAGSGQGTIRAQVMPVQSPNWDTRERRSGWRPPSDYGWGPDGRRLRDQRHYWGPPANRPVWGPGYGGGWHGGPRCYMVVRNVWSDWHGGYVPRRVEVCR